jgi:DNA invertase Pin-like site-specific DNA recombinase
MPKPKPINGSGRDAIRCAIYTRKSSDEGLEQDFNSLDAQREACEAFIKSQRHEGWSAHPTHYDDGGVSGATMHRPALQRLLDAVSEGEVSIVVVYKVDRLTRSLADFAKIVEHFDANGVSFVSVTQQFNTTTSMGRLTLNVLLSFAQFEREVTAERIRDKIAASKQKGMWMGGVPPLGYVVADRQLVIDEAQASTVRYIYRRYVELGSVEALRQALKREGIQSPQRTFRSGRIVGGKPMGRGALYRLLQNRIYRGEVVHKDEAYPGQHDAIIDETLWDTVQSKLEANRVARALAQDAKAPSLLAGRLVDERGQPLTPSHAVKRGKRYRYYISKALTTGRRSDHPGGLRIPAGELEQVVLNRVQTFFADASDVLDALGHSTITTTELETLLGAAYQLSRTWSSLDPAELLSLVKVTVVRVVVWPDRLDIELDVSHLPDVLKSSPADWAELNARRNATTTTDCITLSVAAQLKRAGLGKRLVVPGRRGRRPANPDPTLMSLLVKAYDFQSRVMKDRAASLKTLAREAGVTPSYFTRLLRLSYLAPDITRAIVQGKQPPTLTAKLLTQSSRLPLDWAEQRRLLGFD